MRTRLKEAILKAPIVKVFELALLLGGATVYAGSYAAADYVSQMLAAVACVIALLLIANMIPGGHDERER